jgi:hypothetical protein
MPVSLEPCSVPEHPADLHRRLLADDPTAPADLAATCLEPLVRWLEKHNRRIDPHLCAQAADEAILALIHRPASYRPDRLGLEAYLRMAAQRDLQNLLRSERKHHDRRVPWETVEVAAVAGKYLGRQDDPTLPLRIAEEHQAARAAVPPSVRGTLSEPEARVLTLMEQKERRTAVYAEVLGLTDLPAEQQAREVKRVKDRLKKRLQRAGEDA